MHVKKGTKKDVDDQLNPARIIAKARRLKTAHVDKGCDDLSLKHATKCAKHTLILELIYYTFSACSERLGISRQIYAAKNATRLMGNGSHLEHFSKESQIK